ncbi:MAG: hypothetical protein QXE01_02055 [Sulfolobales archaeon]
MNIKKILGIRDDIAKILYGSSDLRLVKGRIVSCWNKGCVAKGFLIVRDFIDMPEDLSERDLRKILNSYVRTLAENAPIDLRVIVLPTRSDEVIARIEKAIQVKQIILESDPSNEKLRTEIERLKRIKKRILDGEMPFSINMIFGVTALGTTEEEAIEKLSRKMEILKEELRGLGIYVEDLRGLGAIAFINEFFRRA